jgi:hypothetical protein
MSDAPLESNSQLSSMSIEPDPDARPTRRQKLNAVAVSAFGFMVFYLLSAGPMAGLHRVFKVPGFQRAVEVVYAPVVFLVKRNVEPFSSIMRWYVDLFR